MKYDETEHLLIPENNPAIKDLYQIGISIEVKSRRVIDTKDCKTIAIDGIKKFKVVYSQEEISDKMVMLNLKLPYNTYVELPKEVVDIENISIYILDAYFDLLDKRMIYAYFLYLIDVKYSKAGIEKPSGKNLKPIEILSLDKVNEDNVPQIALSHEDFVIFDEGVSNETYLSWESYTKNSNEDMSCLFL